MLNICLARWFPQPDLDLIQRTSPPKFKKKFGSQLVGIIDCTECRMQISSEKMAQRATWSAYKHNNTVKYLIVIWSCHGVFFEKEMGFGALEQKKCYFFLMS